MKITVNKEAAQRRTDEFVEKVIKEAVSTAKSGKVEFSVSISFDEFNGLNTDEIKKKIKEQSEGTIELRSEYSPGDRIILLKIVEVK